MKRVLVLGGYGNFGKRIVENLSEIDNLEILVAGRNENKAKALIAQLTPQSNAKLSPCELDISTDTFAGQLKSIAPFIVIHTSGPFQGQSHHVPQACIDAGSHYIDLADDSRFVCDITKLDAQARQNKVLIVSGASSVPGLSSAVIDYYLNRFSSIDDLDIAIAPGNQAERGEATVRGILSYTGHAFSTFKDGREQQIYGWMNARKNDFGGIVGKRWLANVDVPDLTLFPKRYQVKNAVRFQAGLELPFSHLSMVAMAYLVKKKIIKNWAPFTRPIVTVSNWLIRLGTDIGGMQVKIIGQNQQNQMANTTWTLYAADGIGPYIPTLSAIILTRKLITGEISNTGATPCLGQFELKDFWPYFEQLGIYFKEQHDG